MEANKIGLKNNSKITEGHAFKEKILLLTVNYTYKLNLIYR